MQQNRKICFDTETTGLNPDEGERITEIGCIELINDIRTGKTFQYYLNPEKKLSAESIEICGHSDDFYLDKPKFAEIVSKFLEFIGDSILIAHNANFDINFINHELKLANIDPLKNEVIDTLQIARKKFPGQKVNLDALCKKFTIDNSMRNFHGALLDADLLTDVYIQLIGGVEKKLIEDKESSYNLIDEIEERFKNLLKNVKNATKIESRAIKIDENEISAHNEFIRNKVKNSIWLKEENINI